MKKLFVEARYKNKIKLNTEDIPKLPNKLILATTIQYFDSLTDIKKQLEDAGKQVQLFKGKHQKYPGQVLGCSIDKIDDEGAFFYIGDGLFHPIAFMIKNKDKDVFVFNPFMNQLKPLEKDYVDKFEKGLKENKNKYNQAEKIGIIVTTKPGQERLQDAIELKKRLDTTNKQSQIFLCNTADFSQLINFNYIQCWVNTMCPRIAYDDTINIERPIVNIDEINLMK
ncbi:MAG: diphthamide synthesis protein [Nanoarchaeota archaeon]|nr:diphthamide synthesis protein [Nanoarchaeota archaeon]